MLLRLLTLLAAGLIAASLPAQPQPAGSRLEVEGDTLQLPDMKVGPGIAPDDFVIPGRKEITPPNFPANDPNIDVQFPGRAVYEGVAVGRATVGVLLDETGRPLDFLLIRFTRDYFGKALLAEAKDREYTPKRLKGVPIPATFVFSYHFEPPAGLTNISSFEAAERRLEEVGGGARYAYEPHREETLDGGGLVPTQLSIPVLPAGHASRGAPVKALVSFYVDEQGRVRLPNVESDLPPELVAPAIHALRQWAFKPPTIKSKPVLVRAMRALTFRPAPTDTK
jgi:hypothetical protein